MDAAYYAVPSAGRTGGRVDKLVLLYAVLNQNHFGSWGFGQVDSSRLSPLNLPRLSRVYCDLSEHCTGSLAFPGTHWQP